ncbi:MAG TPA: glycosyltransferase family 25 protein [Anaeromyxobacter sp.]|nr:glycosyltransferase family 25 protein [Anaeromyxobacter sp.]
MTDRAASARPGAAAGRAWAFLNGWADRVYVVSLARAADRRARMRRRLVGLDFRFLDATDKLELDREKLRAEGMFDESRVPRAFRHRAEMVLGHLGCSMSHRRIYEEIVRNGWRRTVVLEDDADPDEGALDRLPEALAQLPATWELCYLGHLTKDGRVGRDAATPGERLRRAIYVALAPLRLVRWRTGEALRLLPRPFSANLGRAGRHFGTHAYAVTLEGARKLLAAQTPVAFNADQLLAYLVLRGRLDAYVTRPVFFGQEAGASPEPGADAPPHPRSGER